MGGLGSGMAGPLLAERRGEAKKAARDLNATRRGVVWFYPF